MASLFLKDISLTKLSYISFTIAGQMNYSGKKLISLIMAYQWVNIRCANLMAFAELFFGSRDLKDFVSTLSNAILALLLFLKSIRFASRTKQIRNLFDRLESIRQTMLNDGNNINFVTDAENLGRTILPPVYLSVVGYPVLGFFVTTLIDFMSNFEEKHLVFRIWTPWNRDTVLVHILSNAFVMVTSSYSLTIYAAFYFMEITFTLYVSAYIKTLQNNLINKGIRNEEIYEHHKVIIQLIRDYNEILSEQMYVETLISPLMPCGYALVLLKAVQKKEITQVIDNFVRAILCLIPSLVSCGCGQEIILQMERLHEATYMSNWYEEEPKIRRDLLIMMIRTTTLTTVNYRLFVTYDYVLLSAVLKVIYSYFMLMVNLDEN